jgi:excisionase family DNA binding protein
MSDHRDHHLTLALPPELVELIAVRAAELIAARAPARPEYLTVAEAAEYIRAKPKRIYDLVSQRRLEPRRDGARLLFLRSELDAYLEGRAVDVAA